MSNDKTRHHRDDLPQHRPSPNHCFGSRSQQSICDSENWSLQLLQGEKVFHYTDCVQRCILEIVQTVVCWSHCRNSPTSKEAELLCCSEHSLVQRSKVYRVSYLENAILEQDIARFVQKGNVLSRTNERNSFDYDIVQGTIGYAIKACSVNVNVSISESTVVVSSASRSALDMQVRAQVQHGRCR